MTELPIIAQLHLMVGTLSVISGFLAVFIRKGGAIHLLLGRTFVVTMTMLCLSGFYLSFSRSLQLTYFLAFFSLYLLLTGWYAMARDSPKINVIDKFGFVLVTLAGLAAFVIGTVGWVYNLPHPEGEPPYSGYYVFVVFAAFVAYKDYKVIKQSHLLGMTRLVRHLWRMIFSLAIATFIFFVGNSHLLPAYLRNDYIISLPILTVLGALVFWLIYVKRTKSVSIEGLNPSGVKSINQKTI